MKDKILAALKQHPGEFVSGQRISEELNVTRAAVWKAIKQLQKDGYLIHSVTRRGYRLEAEADILSEAELRDQLKTQMIGKKIQYYPSLASTNSTARELAEKGEPEGTIVLSEFQSSGKGCIGRPWTSGLGMGINLSILLRPPLELTAAPLLTQIASAATGSVLEKIVPSVQIRWPNDILIKGKKCGGILTESSGEIDCINYSIIGIGLNINQEKTDFPPDLRHAAISLRMATGKKESRKQIVCAILKQLESFYFTLKKEKTATNALSFCRTHSATLGHFLAYQEGEKEQRVLAKDFDEQQGSLLIQFENGDIKALPSANRLCPLK